MIRMVIKFFFLKIESNGIKIIKTMGAFTPEESIRSFGCQGKAIERAMKVNHLKFGN